MYRAQADSDLRGGDSVKKINRLTRNVLVDWLVFIVLSLCGLAVLYLLDWELGRLDLKPLLGSRVIYMILLTMLYSILTFLLWGVPWSYLDNFPLPIGVPLYAAHVGLLWATAEYGGKGVENAVSFSIIVACRWAALGLALALGALLARRLSLGRHSRAAAWVETFLLMLAKSVRYFILPGLSALIMEAILVEDRFIYVGRTFDHLGYDLLYRKEPVFVYLVDIYQILFGQAFFIVVFCLLGYMVELRLKKIPDVVDMPVWKWEYPFRVSGTIESSISHNPLVAKRRVCLYNSYTYFRAVRARQTPVIVTWNSRRDWAMPRRRRKSLLSWLREVEGQGVPIVVQDKYMGAGSYASRGELGEVLTRYPYYRVEGYGFIDKLLLDEVLAPAQEARRTLRQRLNGCMAAARACGDPVLMELTCQVSGASSELTRYFYVLMKLCEYLIHTEALATLCKEEGPVSSPRRLARPTMGDFAEYLPSGGPVVEDREVLDCLRALDLAAARNREGRNRLRKVTYKELCRVLCQVRRRFVGHGTLVYAVSTDMVSGLARVAQYMLERRQTLAAPLPEGEVFRLEERSVPAVVRQKKAWLYYNGMAEEDTWRYLDYVTGQIIACDTEGHVTAHRLRLDTLQEWKEELS